MPDNYLAHEKYMWIVSVTQIINGRSPSGSVGRDGERASVTTRANVVATSRRVASRPLPLSPTSHPHYRPRVYSPLHRHKWRVAALFWLLD